VSARIIDLSSLVPEDIQVRLEKDGELYPLPPDIPIPDYLAIAGAIETLDQGAPAEAVDKLGDIYDRVMDLFRIRTPDIEDLPIGPRRLGELIIQVYGEVDATEEKSAARPPRRAGTRSSSPRPRRKSGSST
jgi:hypothetical protein